MVDDAASNPKGRDLANSKWKWKQKQTAIIQCDGWLLRIESKKFLFFRTELGRRTLCTTYSIAVLGDIWGSAFEGFDCGISCRCSTRRCIGFSAQAASIHGLYVLSVTWDMPVTHPCFAPPTPPPKIAPPQNPIAAMCSHSPPTKLTRKGYCRNEVLCSNGEESSATNQSKFHQSPHLQDKNRLVVLVYTAADYNCRQSVQEPQDDASGDLEVEQHETFAHPGRLDKLEVCKFDFLKNVSAAIQES